MSVMTDSEAGGISVVVAVTADIAGLEASFRACKAALGRLGRPLDFVYVVDGPQTRALAALKSLRRAGEPIEILSFAQAFGGAAVLNAGLREVKGRLVVTLPALVEFDPDELPRLVESLGTADMIVGRRVDPAARGEPKLERAMRLLLKSPFHDLRSEVRVMRKEVAEELTLYGNQHRFLPLIANALGFTVVEIDLPLRRADGRGGMRGVDLGLMLDLATMVFLLRFIRKPFRFFGGLGFGLLVIGGLVTLYLVGVRLFFGVPLADRPALILSTLMVVLGIQVIAMGLIGEIITFAYTREMKEYKIDRVVD